MTCRQLDGQIRAVQQHHPTLHDILIAGQPLVLDLRRGGLAADAARPPPRQEPQHPGSSPSNRDARRGIDPRARSRRETRSAHSPSLHRRDDADGTGRRDATTACETPGARNHVAPAPRVTYYARSEDHAERPRRTAIVSSAPRASTSVCIRPTRRKTPRRRRRHCPMGLGTLDGAKLHAKGTLVTNSSDVCCVRKMSRRPK